MDQQKQLPPHLQPLLRFLRDPRQAGIPTRVGIFNGKRQDYFKGSLPLSLLS